MTSSTGQDASAQEAFQIPIEAAELYEAAFVPAFFSQWAPILCDAAGLKPGTSVLDVACGTGIVARTAADRIGAATVVGVDLNEAMLTVARRTRPDIEWRQGDVTALPFADDSFDVVLCQMALMFFPDRLEALGEMRRVVRRAGKVGLVVPSSLDAQPMFSAFVDLATRVAGAEAEALLTTYFVCGDLVELTSLIESAGLHITSARSVKGVYRAPSIDQAVATEVESTPLVERMSESAYQRLRDEAREALQPFAAEDGTLEAPFECQLVVATPIA